jgi:hypothetical protein
LDLVAADLGISESETIARLLRKRAGLLREFSDTPEMRALQRFVAVGGFVGACKAERADLRTAESLMRLVMGRLGAILHTGDQ